MKEELLLKIREAMNEPIVGNYLFNADELEQIYMKAGVLLLSSNRKTIDDYSIEFVALVNMTKEWKYDEEAFLDYIFRKISSNDSLNQTIYTNLRFAISSLFESKKIYMIEWGKRYYATLCSHALTPISSTESFFDMCWEIYCNDLDQQYEKNDPVYRLIVDSLKNKFSYCGGLDDDIKIGSQAYSMRVGLKGLAIYASDILELLINDTIGAIHSLFNNQPIKSDKYYKSLIIDWWQRKQKTFGISSRYKKEKEERTVTNYSQIRASFALLNNSVYISIPPIRLLNDFDKNPILEIHIGDAIVYQEDMTTRGSGIIMSTNQIKYDLSGYDVVENSVKVIITHCGNEIFNSKNSLVREFMLFKNGKEVTQSECLLGVYELYINKIDSLLRVPLGLIKKGDKLYSFDAIDGEMMQSLSRTVFFYNEQTDKKIYFFAKKKNNAVYKKEGIEYQVIDGELYVDVISSYDIRDIGVRYENTSFRLSEFPCNTLGSKARYEITSLLNVGESQKITLFKYSNNSIVSNINLIKFKNISISFDKPFYYGEDSCGVVTFKTEKYFGEEVFDTKTDKVSIAIEEGELLISIPVLKWKIDEGEWNSSPLKTGLWYRFLSSSSMLYIHAPFSISCSIITSTNKTIDSQDNGHVYYLGNFMDGLLHDQRFNNKRVSILLKIDGRAFLPLFDIVLSEEFSSEPLFISENYKIEWQPFGYIGDAESQFIIAIFEGEECIEKYNVSLAPSTLNCAGIEDGYYVAKVFLKNNGTRGRELYSLNFVFGDERRIKYKNKTLFINSVIIVGQNYCRRDIRPLFVDNIRFLGSMNGFDYYSGELFVITKNGEKYYLDKMKDDKGALIRVNPLRIEMRSERSCYIGYGLEEDDEEFEYDNEFSVDILNRTVIGNYSEGKKTMPIDYFVFDIKKKI